MKRHILIPVLFFSLLLTSCGGHISGPDGPTVGVPDASQDQSQPAAASEEGKIAFTDALGQEFSIDAPERAAVMIGSFADVWVLAGGQNTMRPPPTTPGSPTTWSWGRMWSTSAPP